MQKLLQAKKEMDANQKKQRKLVIQKRLVSMMAVAVIIFAVTIVGYCTPTPTPSPTLTIDFDTTAMFTWAQVIISSLMPVIYVVMGISLGFLIINNLKNAFVGSMH